MAVQFKNLEWEPVTNPLWAVNSWGTDYARVLYRGRYTGKKQFEDSLTRWARLPGYGFMFLEDWAEGPGTPAVPGIELRYIGFRSGSPPPPKSVDGTSIQSAQGEAEYSGTKYSGTILYSASRTTWTWFETATPPTEPRYGPINQAIHPADRIRRWSIKDDSGTVRHSVPLAALTAIMNSLGVPKIIASEYQRENLVPGQLWACRSEVDWKYD